jgi:hypothetical protein
LVAKVTVAKPQSSVAVTVGATGILSQLAVILAGTPTKTGLILSWIKIV